MTKIEAPFQMLNNKVKIFKIKQYDNFECSEPIPVELGVDYKISDITCEEKKMCSEVDLTIQLKGAATDGQKAFEILLVQSGNFIGDATILDDSKFSEMLKINGITTLMQLSRAYITTITSLSGFPDPFVLPMINIFELIRMKEDRDNKDKNN